MALTPVGASLLPGNNQRGSNADDSAYNGPGGPDSPDNNPGDAPDFTLCRVSAAIVASHIVTAVRVGGRYGGASPQEI